MDENTNVDVFENTEEKYPRSFEYVKAQVNVLNEVLQSYFYQGNLELDQTRHIAETRNHEFVDLEMIRLLSKVCAFCEEGHAIMDCLFVSFHIRTSIARHVELQNVAGVIINQPQEHESRILVVQNRFKGMELGSQLGPQSR